MTEATSGRSEDTAVSRSMSEATTTVWNSERSEEDQSIPDVSVTNWLSIVRMTSSAVQSGWNV